LEKVVLNHKGASAEVYLWGATLTSYKPASGKENIFVSPGAKFDGVKAIRGGVPVVFPQWLSMALREQACGWWLAGTTRKIQPKSHSP